MCGLHLSIHIPFKPLCASQRTFQIQKWKVIFFCHIKLTQKHQGQTKIFRGITTFWGNQTNNDISLSLKDNYPPRVMDWKVSMYFFKCKQTSRECFNSWNGYQKLYIPITWFSDSVQAGIFVAEHEVWRKTEFEFVKKIIYYMYH